MPVKETLTEDMTLTLTPEMKERIYRKAVELGMPATLVVRLAVDEVYPKETETSNEES